MPNALMCCLSIGTSWMRFGLSFSLSFMSLGAEIENKMSMDTHTQAAKRTETIEMPAPTVWPSILAFGLTLVFAGLVTSSSVSLLGAILGLSGCIGWFHDV